LCSSLLHNRMRLWEGVEPLPSTVGRRSEALADQLLALLVGENVDCVLRAGELTDQSLIARRIALLQMVTCAAPSYLARYGEPRHPTDLERDHRVVKYFRASDGRPLSLDFTRDGETLEIAGRYAVAFNEGSACVVATVAGLGILQGPKFMIQQYLDDGTLRQVLSDSLVGLDIRAHADPRRLSPQPESEQPAPGLC
jgi:DNA-binding transcriptional LysR family regulator